MLMLSFLALCAIYSFSLVFGILIAVRILLPLALRECEGVRGGRGSSCSCFLVTLKLRVSGGKPTGVDDAMVPPTPAREVASGLILRGAYLVIEHGVGSMLVAGVMRAGLCGEPMAMTNGTLELEAALSFRSEGENDRIGVSAALDPADIARERSVAGGRGGGELAMLIRMSSFSGGGTMRTVDALDTVRDLGGSCKEALDSGE
jgi:hypothetical protein